MDELKLSSEQVLAQLEAIANRDHRRARWSTVAALLHRVDTEHLYLHKMAPHGHLYATAEAYADCELGMARSEYFAHRRLGRLIEKDRLQPWELLTRSQAVQISRLAGLDDIGPWVAKALHMPYWKFRLEVDRFLKPNEERWVKYSFFAPESFAMFWDEALLEGLRLVLEIPDPDPALIEDPKMRFRCVEAFVQIAREASLTVSALTRTLRTSIDALEAAGRSDLAEQLTAQVVEIASTTTTRTAPRSGAEMDQSAHERRDGAAGDDAGGAAG